MKLREVADHLGAQVLAGEELLDVNVDNVFCTDVMADVLAFASSDTVLITRLVNLSVVRSSIMAEVHCVVFSDGILPPPSLLHLAETHEIAVMAVGGTMFHAVNLLMEAGLDDAAWV